jgi:hypothetical protein
MVRPLSNLMDYVNNLPRFKINTMVKLLPGPSISLYQAFASITIIYKTFIVYKIRLTKTFSKANPADLTTATKACLRQSDD